MIQISNEPTQEHTKFSEEIREIGPRGGCKLLTLLSRGKVPATITHLQALVPNAPLGSSYCTKLQRRRTLCLGSLLRDVKGLPNLLHVMFDQVLNDGVKLVLKQLIDGVPTGSDALLFLCLHAHMNQRQVQAQGLLNRGCTDRQRTCLPLLTDWYETPPSSGMKLAPVFGLP